MYTQYYDYYNVDNQHTIKTSHANKELCISSYSCHNADMICDHGCSGVVASILLATATSSQTWNLLDVTQENSLQVAINKKVSILHTSKDARLTI